MSSSEYDVAPRDDILPTADEIRRSPVARAPHPDEFDAPDDLKLDEEQITRSRMPSVSWPTADADSPDYAHLQPQGREPIPGDKRFKLTAADFELLFKANGFDPKGPDTRIVFGLRGCTLIDNADGDNDGTVAGVDAVELEETRPNHRQFRCTIGYLNRSTGKISAFRASTVPNVKFMTNYFMWNNGLGGNSNTGANMLPTGCYVYRMGAHGGGRIYPALRLTNPERLAEDGQVCVFRTKNDLTYKTDDVFDHCMPYDNIHCAYAYDSFSSAGCQTVQGPNGEGPWGDFQAVLKTVKPNTRFDYVLLTGREASIAHWIRTNGRSGDTELVARMLGRLRPGSSGPAVARLQEKLGMKASGYFGAATKKKLSDYQRSKGLLIDGVWSPAAEAKIGWAVFAEPPPAPPVQPEAPVAAPAPAAPTPAAPAPIAPAVTTTEPAPVAQAPAGAAPAETAVAPPPPPAAVPAPAAPDPTPTAAPVQAVAPTVAAAAATAAAAPAVAAAITPAAAPPPSPSAVPTAPPSQPPVAAVPPLPAAAPPPPVATKPAPPPGVSAAVAAELEKLAGQMEGSAEAPGIIDIATTRSGFTSATEIAAAAQGAAPGTPIVPAIAPAPGPTTAPAAAPAPGPVAAPAPVTAPPVSTASPSTQPTPPAPAPQPASPAIVGTGQKLIIDANTIAAFARNALPQYKEAFLRGNEMLTRYGINQNPMRLCHFLGQIGNECGRLTIIEENMTYRSAARLRQVWPSRFPTLASAEPFVNNPQKLADKVYGGRFDNKPGDGWRYRGRGLVQITGRSSYREMGKKLGIPLEDQPDLASDPRHALAIACETWAGKTLAGERDMNRLADANKLEAMTYRINGGYTNIEDRRDAFEEAWDVWGSGNPPRRTLEPDTLDRGDRGGKVEELNARLKELGLFDGITSNPPQSVYNFSTYKAVRALQEDCGLNQTGVCGNDTWAALEKTIDRGGLTRSAPTRGTSRSPSHAPGTEAETSQRDAVASRLKEIRAWSIALTILAVAFVAGYIYALTHSTGNTPLWMPLVFSGMVFVTGLALWLAARPQPSWNVPDKPSAVTRSAPTRQETPSGFIPGDEEPVRMGTNLS
jgi:predicted chitinase